MFIHVHVCSCKVYWNLLNNYGKFISFPLLQKFRTRNCIIHPKIFEGDKDIVTWISSRENTLLKIINREEKDLTTKIANICVNSQLIVLMKSFLQSEVIHASSARSTDLQ